MKRYTSRFLKSVAAAYFAFPLVYLAVVAVLFDIPASPCVRILLSPLFFIVCGLAIASGYGFWEMKRWAWYLFVPTNLLIAYATAIFGADYGESHHQVLAFAGCVFGLVALTYRVAREVRVPYFFPKIRWWESDPRYRLSSPAKLRRQVNGEEKASDAEILDISTGGCFLKTRDDLRQDEEVVVAFSIFGIPVSCAGNVVWRTQSTVTHPKGIGVKFSAIEKAQRRCLRQITRRLKEIASFYRRSRYLMNEEDFLKRLEQLGAKNLADPNPRKQPHEAAGS